MTHEQMLRFKKYAKALPESRALCIAVVRSVEEAYLITPTETRNGYLVYHPNFLLIETIGVRETILTLNVYGPKEEYGDLAGGHVRVGGGMAGITKLYVTGAEGLPSALAAVQRSWDRKQRALRR
jgi:hypothetical protein